jgi:hypothetical protein
LIQEILLIVKNAISGNKIRQQSRLKDGQVNRGGCCLKISLYKLQIAEIAGYIG